MLNEIKEETLAKVYLCSHSLFCIQLEKYTVVDLCFHGGVAFDHIDKKKHKS